MLVPSAQAAPAHPLTPVMRRALHTLSPIDWLGSREAAAHGQTLSALADRGLARCAWTHRPHRRLVARLTPAGVLASHGPQGVSRSRDGLMLEALALDALEFGGPRGLTLMELAELCEATGGRPAISWSSTEPCPGWGGACASPAAGTSRRRVCDRRRHEAPADSAGRVAAGGRERAGTTAARARGAPPSESSSRRGSFTRARTVHSPRIGRPRRLPARRRLRRGRRRPTSGQGHPGRRQDATRARVRQAGRAAVLTGRRRRWPRPSCRAASRPT